ncbi:MAG: enoyl-CoA hydratase [Alphaproteobacteria bacterium]|nr:enoyl-CoA hydratase [Alphaproteobacteria bacterium]
MPGQTRTSGTRALGLSRSGSVLTLTLQRPEASNAVNAEMRAMLLGALREAKADPSLRALVLTGAGDDVFSTGLDLPELAVSTPAEGHQIVEELRAVHLALMALDIPTIAVIKGACIGAGLELALHCDLRFARNDARFASPGVTVGIVPGGGSILRLQQLIGAGAAQALLLTGSVINAERAFLIGLVTNVIAPGAFDEAVAEFAGYLAMLPPVAVRELKRLLRSSSHRDGDALALESAEAMARCLAEEEAIERLRAMFVGAGPDTTVH